MLKTFAPAGAATAQPDDAHSLGGRLSVGFVPHGLLAAALVLACLLVLAAATPAQAAKQLDSVLGGFGTEAGQFRAPDEVAVRQSTGQLYVADRGNFRIQRFAGDGAFELMWGRDVRNPAGGTALEVCTAADADTANGGIGCTTGTSGDGAGEFSPAAKFGLAIDQATGHVYVADRDAHRIQVFDADGQFLSMWGWDVRNPAGDDAPEICTAADADTGNGGAGCKAGVGGTMAGQLNSPDALAVGATGNVYVGDVISRRVSKFAPDRSFVMGWGWGVDTGAEQFETCTAASGCQLGISGEGLGQFDFRGFAGVALDDDEGVYVANGSRLQRFDSDGANPTFVDPPTGVGSEGVRGVTIGADGHIYSVHPNAGEVHELLPDGSPAAVHGSEVQMASFLQSVALHDSSGRLYLAYSQGPFTGDSYVLVLDDDGGVTPASTTVSPVTAVGAHAATLNGTVTPGGLSTTYRFQISTNGVTWTDAGPVQGAGSGNAAVPVSQTVSGLEANKFYRVRILATKQFTPEVESAEAVFLTDAVAPELSKVSSQRVSPFTAQLVGWINPNNLQTSYHFEYGTTTGYGSKVPVPSGDAGSDGLEQRFVAQISGLTPGTTYHYRLVATNAQGTTTGADKTLTTRTAAEPPDGRAYEMVTPPDKNSRRSGTASPHSLPTLGIASPDGEAYMLSLTLGSLGPGNAYPNVKDTERFQRTADGWDVDALVNVPAMHPAAAPLSELIASSSDFRVQTRFFESPLFPSGSPIGTRVFGEGGGYLGSGWHDWLGDVALAESFNNDRGVLSSNGEHIVRWSGPSGYRGLLGVGDPSLQQIANNPATTALEGGSAVYRQSPPGSGAKELVNECTGTGADATLLPARDDKGTVSGGPQAVAFSASTTIGSAQVTVNTMAPGSPPFTAGQRLFTLGAGAAFPAGTTIVAVSGTTLTMSAPATSTVTGALIAEPNTAAVNDDTIASRQCEQGTVTSVRGAVGGGGGSGSSPASGVTRNAVSEDGRRIFFTSPDPTEPGVPTACTQAAGAATSCPPQLFVRQYDSNGDPTVRWISRTAVANQDVDMVGRGVGFEGASADGQVVYFRTNAKLLASDPNAGSSTAASANSWDLYRYELPESLDDDPAAGTLTRVSGGPSGSADPNVHTGGDAAGVARFISRDGQRVYFVTRGVIGGVDSTPPAGSGQGGPSGTASNSSTRNLYLYDHAKSGADRWTYVGQLPMAAPGFSVATCAVSEPESGFSSSNGTLSGSAIIKSPGSCVRGTVDGELLAFESAARLTADDDDDAADVYVYDAVADELLRASAPPGGASAYNCLTQGEPRPCNASLGVAGLDIPRGDAFGGSGVQHVNVARDGDGVVSVFFESRLPLSPDDSNGRMDVYEWRAGEVSLISPGQSDDDSYFAGSSLDGRDVFFATQQRIDPREIDTADWDIYDARVGGGFPPPPLPPPGCDVLGDGCQGAGAGGSQPSLDDRLGGGNAEIGDRIVLTLQAPSAAARRRAARSGVLAVKVRATGTGTVRAVARGRLVGKRAVLARGTKRVSRAGAATVRLRLSFAARRALRRGRSVALALELRMPGARAQTATVRLAGSGR